MKKSSWNDGHSSSVIDFVLQNVSKPDYILFAISEIRFHRKDWCSRNAWSLLREIVIALYSGKTFTQQHVGVRNADSYIEIKFGHGKYFLWSDDNFHACFEQKQFHEILTLLFWSQIMLGTDVVTLAF